MFSNKHHYYIGITISISSAWSTCVLFISVMQLVNGAQLLNKLLFYLELFTVSHAAVVFGTLL